MAESFKVTKIMGGSAEIDARQRYGILPLTSRSHSALAYFMALYLVTAASITFQITFSAKQLTELSQLFAYFLRYNL
jgi:hypothetical protein